MSIYQSKLLNIVKMKIDCRLIGRKLKCNAKSKKLMQHKIWTIELFLKKNPKDDKFN